MPSRRPFIRDRAVELIADIIHSVSNVSIAGDGLERFESLLKTLTPREERVLLLRYGIISGRRMAWREVAAQFSLSVGQILLIKEKAFRKLRNPLRFQTIEKILC